MLVSSTAAKRPRIDLSNEDTEEDESNQISSMNNNVLQLVTPHILRRRTTYNYRYSSSEIKATVEYFLKITAKDRNLCRAAGDEIVNQIVGVRRIEEEVGGGGDGRIEDTVGGGGDGSVNLSPHPASCSRSRRCRECLNLLQGQGYEREKANFQINHSNVRNASLQFAKTTGELYAFHVLINL